MLESWQILEILNIRNPSKLKVVETPSETKNELTIQIDIFSFLVANAIKTPRRIGVATKNFVQVGKAVGIKPNQGQAGNCEIVTLFKEILEPRPSATVELVIQAQDHKIKFGSHPIPEITTAITATIPPNNDDWRNWWRC